MKETKKEGNKLLEKHERELERLKGEINTLEDKVKETENNWKRALADYKNLEKRSLDEKVQYTFYIKKHVIEAFLPFLDDIEKLKEHVEDEGLHIVIKNLKTALKDMGVEEIETEGKEFDHNLMEAIETRKGPKNKVLETYVKGYLLNKNLLRPAKVVVGQE